MPLLVLLKCCYDIGIETEMSGNFRRPLVEWWVYWKMNLLIVMANDGDDYSDNLVCFSMKEIYILKCGV